MKKPKNFLMIFFLIIAGGIMGNIIGRLFYDVLPILKISEGISFGPATLDFNFLSVTFGFRFALSLAGLIGVAIVLIIFKIFY